MKFRLKKPKNIDITSEEFSKVFTKRSTEIFQFARQVSNIDYLYWDEFLYKEPAPKGISKEMLWWFTKTIRLSQFFPSPIKDKNGNFFAWSKLPYFEEFFHELDMNTGGGLFIENAEADKINKQKFISRGIMEEAIASSQLEGAASSRQAAKKMLREGRKPRNQSEQMIVNSYLSMRAIEEYYKDKKMSFELLLEMHGMITRDTLDSEGERPRLRQGSDPVVVSDKMDGTVYYEGPPASFVKEELERLIKFANDELLMHEFVHPVVKAIMLHFWIGYLHPFTDGNGRLARQIFYWYLIRRGYWAFAYLPISKAIKLSPKQYIMSYVYSEQDENDLSYFINYNVKKIKQAVKEFNEYVSRQSRKNVLMRRKYSAQYDFNERQIHLLQYLHGDIDGSTTLAAHMNVNQIAKMTAAKDLKDLVKKGFLEQTKTGRKVFYTGTKKIEGLFEAEK